MIRRHLMALRLALMLGDGVTAALVFLLVSLVRFGDGQSSEFWRQLGIDIRLAAALFGVVWVSALWSRPIDIDTATRRASAWSCVKSAKVGQCEMTG